SGYFYEDFSGEIISDEVLSRLISLPNVIVTSHQAFLTKEALENIADTTIENLITLEKEGTSPNEVK
ncbi:MAG: 2-hydroxyacid dehydrogenase, partial [Clostridiales bacterium]|nr:2-hydroxyacid dehydrogenase [Clostridiales bacterium]